MKRCILIGLLIGLVASCGPSVRGDGDGGGSGTECPLQCSADLHDVLDCNGAIVQTCPGASACDPASFTCVDACAAAQANNRSIGCDYYATDMDVQIGDYCFAAIVANTWSAPAHIEVAYGGQQLTVAQFARLPVGSGPTLSYAPYDPALGLPPGEVAILFLSGQQGQAPFCPAPAAVPEAGVNGTTIAQAFHITTDVPVVAYQINPYGGGSTAVTAASLLLPTSVWGLDYVALNVSPNGGAGFPSLNIIASEDATSVTLTPSAAIVGGGGVPGGPALQPLQINLNKGQHAQITQPEELTGTLTSNKPIGFMAGQVCMNMPTGVSFCDHGEQMIPPVRALGSRYVGVMYRPRVANETSTYWRLVGAVDGTQLTWSTPVGGPATLNRGESVLFQSGTPFQVKSQDKDHPFALFTYMTSSTFNAEGYGDPDFVVSVPPEQYLSEYVFFADPTYPETNLVLVRGRASDGQYKDVVLDCLGTVIDWLPVDAEFEYARVDLVTGDFAAVGACSTGRHEISSAAPFGLWVWGWGTPLTATFTANVSYGYPGGMNVTPINDVILRAR